MGDISPTLPNVRWEGGVREGKGVIYMVAEGCVEVYASEP